MGMTAGGSKKLTADINVVPLVDITLVLLIIFMVMTPISQRGYDMSIPEKSTVPISEVSPTEQMIVIMNEEGKIIFNKNEVATPAQLTPRVKELLIGRAQNIVFFQAHDNLFYQEVIEVMDAIRAAGAVVGLVTTELQ